MENLLNNHVRLITQPIKEPDKIGHLEQIIEMIGDDQMIMFSSDYPHWDFDSPRAAFNHNRDRDLKKRILRENAKHFMAFIEGGNWSMEKHIVAHISDYL